MSTIGPPPRVTGGDTIGPFLYRLDDAARLLSCSKRTVERLIAQDELEAVGSGKLRRVLYESIVAYIQRHRGSN